MLTGRYLKGIPADSRAAQGKSLAKDWLTDTLIGRLNGLNDMAAGRGQTLAQMAVAWTLRDARVTSALIGASRASQVADCVGALARLDFTAEELARIDDLSAGGDVNIWRGSTEDAGED
jgi:L-glyceraldehyde 3-phosphate reductase